MSNLKHRVQIIGNIGNAPEIVNLENGGKVAKFSIAIDESYKDQEGNKVEKTEWINIEAWGKKADVIEQFAKKGNLIGIEGKLKTTIQEKEDVKKYFTVVRVSDITLLPNAKSSEA